MKEPYLIITIDRKEYYMEAPDCSFEEFALNFLEQFGLEIKEIGFVDIKHERRKK